MKIWSPLRITAFLTIWALTTPFKVVLFRPRLDYSLIYAGLWSYMPGGNPFSDSPLILSGFVTASLLPFYAPALAVSWFVWQGSKNENLTRMRYFEINLMLVLIQTLLALIIPCMGDTLCIPTPTTGIVALLFVSRIVKEIKVPWSEDNPDDCQQRRM